MNRFLRSPGRGLIMRLAIFAGMFPLIGWLGGSYWLLDLFNHFQLQYAGFIGFCLVISLCLKAWRLVIVVAVVFMLPVGRIGSSLWPAKEEAGGTTLRIANFNVLTSNTRYADAVAWIRATDPDVIFLPEVDEVWAAELKPLHSSHPYAVEHFVEGNFGFACYSKLPILKKEIMPCGELKLPLLKLRLQGRAGEFTFFAAHPVPPSTEFWAGERDVFLKVIADQVQAEEGPVVLAGDLNATAWSHGMKPLFGAGLRGPSVSPTWQRGTFIFAVPIDHLLYRGPKTQARAAKCRKHWVGPDLGSDHRPVAAEIAW